MFLFISSFLLHSLKPYSNKIISEQAKRREINNKKSNKRKTLRKIKTKNKTESMKKYSSIDDRFSNEEFDNSLINFLYKFISLFIY